MNKNIIILGAGGCAREVAWLIEDINKKNFEWNILGFIEEGNKNVGKVLNKYPILCDLNWIEHNYSENLFYVCAVSAPSLKNKFVKIVDKFNIKPAILIHPGVIISKYNIIGEGSIIFAGSIITVNITIGKHVIIYIDSTIGHDAKIGDFTTILPSVNVSGNVNIGSSCNISTAVAIINKVNIGSNTIIGAGATVINDIPSNCTAVGTPAKPIKFSSNS
jgi:sugar O-acyltransferase (sialic acid O-acetyltransferase NeuD family)